MIKLIVYVPEAHLEKVKRAMFEAGAGKTQRYEQCSWQTLGKGQFKPLPGSSPAIGDINEFTELAEYRLEMICADSILPAVIAAMKQAHPYEEPAYGAWRLLDV